MYEHVHTIQPWWFAPLWSGDATCVFLAEDGTRPVLRIGDVVVLKEFYGNREMRRTIVHLYNGEELGADLTCISLASPTQVVMQAALRKHMNIRGDDRCHVDDHELYETALPEGDTRPACDSAVTLENCIRYIACRQQGREYISPQRTIETLEFLLRRMLETACAYDVVTSDGPMVDHRDIPAYAAAQRYLVAHGMLTAQQCRKE